MYMVVTKGNGKDVASSIVLQTEVQRMYLQADSFAKTNDKMCVCMCVCVCVCVCVCTCVLAEHGTPDHALLSPTELRLVGGGARNLLWQRVIADAFQLPIR